MKDGKRIILFFGLFLCLASAWAGRSFLGKGALRHLLLPAIQTQLPGLQVQFQGLDTNLSSRLRLTELSIDYCPDDNCLHLNVPNLTLSYSLSKILSWHGTDSLLRELAIDLHGAAISADFTTKDSSFAASTIILPALPTLPAINLRDASLSLKVDGSSLQGQGITVLAPFFDTKQANSYRVDLRADSLAIAGGSFPPQQGSLTITLDYQPGRLEVPSVTFQEALLLDAGFLETDAQGLRFSMNLHLLQSQGLVSGSMDQEALNLSFHLKEGNLQELIKIAEDSLDSSSTSAKGQKSQIKGRLQADGELNMDFAHPDELQGTFDMKIVDGSWNSSPITLFEVSARAADQILSIDSLKGIIDQNQLTVTNGVVPIPALKKKAWLPLLAASRATAHLRLATPSSLPPIWSEPFLRDWQELGLQLASMDLTLQNNRLRIPQAEVSGQAGHLEIKDAELTLDSNVSVWQEIPLSMRLTIALNDAAVVHHFYEDWPATGGKAQATGAFSGSLAQPHLPFEASFSGAAISGVTLDTVAGKGEWSKDRLALDLKVHNREQDQLTFRGTIDLEQGGLLATTISTNLVDMQPYLPSSLVGNTVISGSLSATANLAGPFSELTGTLSAAGEWYVQGTKLSTAALDTNFNSHKLSLKRLSMIIDDALRIDATGQVEPSRNWGSAAIDLDQLALSYHDQDLNLTSPGGLTISAKAITVRSPLSFSGPLGRFRLQSQNSKSAGLTLVAEELRDTGLLEKVSGKNLGFAGMNFTLAMNGPLSHPDWRWQGNIQRLSVNGPDLSMDGTFDLSYGDNGLQIRQCTFTNTDNAIKIVGQLPLIFKDQQWAPLPSPLQLTAKIDLPKGGILPHLFPEWLATSGDVRADLNVSGTISQPMGELRFSGTDLNPGPNLLISPPGPFDAKAMLTIEKDRLDINNFEITSPGLTLQSTGRINQLPLTALVDSNRDTLPGQVEIDGQYTMPALNWLATKVPTLRRTKGSASGTFALRGPLAHPEIQASLSVKNGAVRGSDSLLVFRDIALDAVLLQEKITIQSLSGTLGGSPLQISGQVNAIVSDAPELDLRLTGKDLLLYRADGFKIRADTTIALTGTTTMPLLSGEIMLTDSKITKRVDWLSFLKPGTTYSGSAGFTLFSFTDAPLKDTRLNLHIKAAQPLMVANNVFKGEVRPDLLLTGSGEVPYLKGVIYADTGRITLPSGRLYLERGLIRFTESAPDKPQLEFQASGRMMAYDITAQIRGHYDEPEVTLSSVPPLANDDLLMLLLTGRQPVNAGQSNSGVSTVAVYFGRGLLTRLFGEEADQLLLLDHLEVDVGRAVSQLGEPTLDAKIKLTDNLWLPNTSYYLTGEKDVWDYYNAGLRAVFHFR